MVRELTQRSPKAVYMQLNQEWGAEGALRSEEYALSPAKMTLLTGAADAETVSLSFDQVCPGALYYKSVMMLIRYTQVDLQ